MKKFLLWLLVIASFSVSLQTFAIESPVQKVYKIQGYKWDAANEYYKYISYGSAVLIGKNKIITNAHAVLDDTDMPIGNYNLCISETFDTEPKCKTSLKLIKYDKTNDLAILEPVENISLGNPVQASDRKLDLWETVKVYGYPENGGETITLTEGKVSGLDNGHYKIDANIDAGNSGGGAFDKDGKFIGIPYGASVGYSTLGYIIPVSMIKDFFAGKGDITAYGEIDPKFQEYIHKMNQSILNQKIDNPYIEFDGFQKRGFILKAAYERPNSTINSYTLYSKTQDTTISLWTVEIYGKKYIYDLNYADELRKTYSRVIEKRNITIGGKKIYRILASAGEIHEDGTVDNNILSIFFDLGTIGYTIDTRNYTSEKEAIKSALTLFVKNLKIKKESSLIDTAVYTDDVGSFSIISGMSVEKSIGSMDFIFDSSIQQDGSIEVKHYDCDCAKTYSTYTFEDAAPNFMESTDTEDTTQTDIRKNLLWIYYLNTKTKQTDGTTKMIGQFFTKINEALTSVTITLISAKEDAELEKKYYQFLDTINLNGVLPFKSATVWVIKIDSSSDTSSETP